MTELSKKSGVSSKYLRRIKVEDDWDDYAQEVWASRSASTLKVRTVEEQSLIDGEKERQHREIPKLQVEAERLLETLTTLPPEGKAYSAVLSAMVKVRAMLEGSTHYDLAKQEAQARMRLSLTTPTNTPSTATRDDPEPQPQHGQALDFSDWDEELEAEPDQHQHQHPEPLQEPAPAPSPQPSQIGRDGEGERETEQSGAEPTAAPEQPSNQGPGVATWGADTP
jgi:hypothetical protein